jgi:hypothetical protein
VASDFFRQNLGSLIDIWLPTEAVNKISGTLVRWDDYSVLLRNDDGTEILLYKCPGMLCAPGKQ